MNQKILETKHPACKWGSASCSTDSKTLTVIHFPLPKQKMSKNVEEKLNFRMENLHPTNKNTLMSSVSLRIVKFPYTLQSMKTQKYHSTREL